MPRPRGWFQEEEAAGGSTPLGPTVASHPAARGACALGLARWQQGREAVPPGLPSAACALSPQAARCWLSAGRCWPAWGPPATRNSGTGECSARRGLSIWGASLCQAPRSSAAWQGPGVRGHRRRSGGLGVLGLALEMGQHLSMGQGAGWRPRASRQSGTDLSSNRSPCQEQAETGGAAVGAQALGAAWWEEGKGVCFLAGGRGEGGGLQVGGEPDEAACALERAGLGS